MAILWLASFPKSGNTWLRAFLANYFADAAQPVSLAALQRFGFSDAHGWPYEKLAGRPHGTLSEPEIAELRPKVHAMFAHAEAGNVMVKTHNAIGELSGVPTVDRSTTLGAIYVMRNPWDVAVSYADHFGFSIDETIEAFRQEKLSIEPSDQNVRQYLGGWSGHIASWYNAEWLSLLAIRYEDMIADPKATFGKVLDFLDLPKDRKRLDKAIKFASFRELARQEARNGFAEKSENAERFFRKGRVGSWREVLSAEQADRLVLDHRPALEKFGYLNASGEIDDGSQTRELSA